MKESKIQQYQKLLEAVDSLKGDFLFQVRVENRNTPDERIGIFVDIQNVYYGAMDNFKRKIDFKKLTESIVKGRKLTTCNAYVVKGDNDNSNFVGFLKQIGYSIVSKDLKKRSDGTAKGNLDIEMAIDIITEKDKLDTVVLVSGDGDFVALVELLKAQNIQVEVYSFSNNKNTTSQELKNVASKFFEIDETYLFEEIKKGSK
ncbi:MAG: NYN domain-containing protein [Candidatus Nanoarchaeia archaeon]|jgi:uncharacterized LabA/DUF88 family protein|nr:NYN domain-containing protein [Candidatus Nanoarchaeia archaeon]